MHSIATFKKRQATFLSLLPKGSAAILFAASEKIRTGDTAYPFRQNSDFYYLTGFNEPEAVAVFLSHLSAKKYILFVRKRERAKEQWEGFRAGVEDAVDVFGADEAYPIEELNHKMSELLKDCQTIFYPLLHSKAWSQKIFSWVKVLKNQIRLGVDAPFRFESVNQLLDEMRLIKDADEIQLMRQSAQISADAHARMMAHCKSCQYEYHLEAEFLHEITRRGSRYPAYPAIVGSGRNACILHYHENSAPLKAGDLVLVDAGGEYQSYASDITRTFPVNGQFSKAQAAVYDLVLAAQMAGIAEVYPGNTFEKIQEKILAVFVQGLIDLGILKGTLADCIAKKAYFDFYMHSSGHWLGLDTHDVGSYKINKQSRTLKPGMVLTVEPGLYFLDDLQNIPDAYKNIGIRIEDDILVTESGHEVLSKDAPKTRDEIENLMRE